MDNKLPFPLVWPKGGELSCFRSSESDKALRGGGGGGGRVDGGSGGDLVIHVFFHLRYFNGYIGGIVVVWL